MILQACCKLLFHLTTVSNENSSQVALEDVMPWKYGGAFLAACSWGDAMGLVDRVPMMDPWTLGPSKNLHVLEVFMVNNLVFRWPKPLFFHGFGGPWYLHLVDFHGTSTCST